MTLVFGNLVGFVVSPSSTVFRAYPFMQVFLLLVEKPYRPPDWFDHLLVWTRVYQLLVFAIPGLSFETSPFGLRGAWWGDV